MQSNIDAKRHTLAHLLAASVRDLFPGSQNAIGPAIENGFYQDFEVNGKVSDEDLPAIEAKMKELLKGWKEFEKKEVNKEEALKEFSWNKYKSELIEDFARDGKDMTFYTVGGFIDLCKGGHSNDPSKEIAPDSFKLERVAGAYWKGDEKNKMLTRIYGLAFNTKEELEAHLAQVEEAKKRDHKKLGRELGLFVFSELVGPGLPLWTPKGTVLREVLNDFVFELRKKYGYQKVSIPHITKKDLYEKSGHWEKYKDDLFKIETREKHLYAMKPMNCPHHTQIFDAEPRSYRDMPQRYCETTMVYRDEQSGELAGLSRVLSITQDDAHVFCRINQIQEEAASVWNIINEFYTTFNFKLTPRLSRRGEEKDKYLGDEKNWDLAEDMLKKVILDHTSDYIDGPDEAAFYGPKIDFMANDAIGRKHQVATIQLDFVQPERFGLCCTNEKGEKENIAMFHVAIMGSIERFLSVIIEHYAGTFPLWLSPVQVKIVPIGDNEFEYAKKFKELLQEHGIRTELDASNESLGKRIRAAKMEKVPYVAVIGKKEVESGNVTLEGRTEKFELTLDAALEKLVLEIKNKS